MDSYLFEMFCRLSDAFFKLAIPEYESIDDFLDGMIPKIEHLGEDLREKHFYTSRYWIEHKEDNSGLPDEFRAEYGHIFFKAPLDGEKDKMITSHGQDKGADHYLIKNGHINRGTWAYFSAENKLIIKESKDAMMHYYDLAFMNDYFFILLKHGDQQRIRDYHERLSPGKNAYSKYLIMFNQFPVSILLRHNFGVNTMNPRSKDIIRLLYYFNFYQNFVIPIMIIGVPIFLFILYILYITF